MHKKNIILFLEVVTFCALTYSLINYFVNERSEGITLGPAPELKLRTFDGKDTTLSAYKGKLIVVNFWATWCPPCLKELPYLIKVAQKYPEKVHFLAVLTSDEPMKAMALIGKESPPENFKFLIDPFNGAKSFGTVKLPETFIVGADLSLLEKITGDASDNLKDLPQILERYLKP